jgi:hypothetical protein
MDAYLLQLICIEERFDLNRRSCRYFHRFGGNWRACQVRAEERHELVPRGPEANPATVNEPLSRPTRSQYQYK